MKVTDLRRKLAATLAACGMLGPSVSHAADLNTNLVVNGGFETVDLGTTGGAYAGPQIQNWTATGLFAYAHTGQGGVGADYANGRPLAGGGQYYFSADNNVPDTTAAHQAVQNLTLSGGASGTLIATGNAAFNLSAFFSGYLAQVDKGVVQVDFLNGVGATLGTASVTNTDVSTWNQYFSGGTIPIGTATARVSVFGAPGFQGGPSAYIDNVSLQVTNEVIQQFLSLTVDRDNGSLVITNRTGAPVNISAYSITSAFEGMSPANWLSIADNYDSGNPGLNQFDAAHQWTELTDPATRTDLSEVEFAANVGASLGHTKTINISSSGGWIRTPTEDLVFNYISGGVLKTGIVTFVDNGGVPFARGDLNTDGAINAVDWGIFRSNQFVNHSGKSLAEAYRVGDLTADKVSNHNDFRAFKIAYDAANGVGAFAAMVAGVPEPSSLVLLVGAGLLGLPIVRKNGIRRS
jgi:hypothetical protein